MNETKSAEIFAKSDRKKRIERVTDKLGRILGFKRLTHSQRNHVNEMSPGLDGIAKTKIIDADGIEREVDIPRRMELYLAAMVREIDGNPFPFPKSRSELDSIMDSLDDEGMNAAMEAFAKLHSEEDAPPGVDIIEQAKN